MDEVYQEAVEFVIDTLEACQQHLLTVRGEIIDRTLAFGSYALCDVTSDRFIEDLTLIALDYVEWEECHELEMVMNGRDNLIVCVCETFSQDEDVQAAVLRLLKLEG